MEDISKITATKSIHLFCFDIKNKQTKLFSNCSPRLKWTTVLRLKFRSLIWQIKINQKHYKMWQYYLRHHSGRWIIFIDKCESYITLTWSGILLMKRRPQHEAKLLKFQCIRPSTSHKGRWHTLTSFLKVKIPLDQLCELRAWGVASACFFTGYKLLGLGPPDDWYRRKPMQCLLHNEHF